MKVRLHVYARGGFELVSDAGEMDTRQLRQVANLLEDWPALKHLRVTVGGNTSYLNPAHLTCVTIEEVD